MFKHAEQICKCWKAQLDIRLPFDPWDDRLSPGKAPPWKIHKFGSLEIYTATILDLL
jgi:hypothetical protein